VREHIEVSDGLDDVVFGEVDRDDRGRGSLAERLDARYLQRTFEGERIAPLLK
jgi:hypothetical protein